MSPSSPRSPRAAPMDLPPVPPSPPARPTVVPPAAPPLLETNTLALLLPHPFLFSPPLQSLLREHYETYGEIRAWAPIRAFGRVIIVYETFAAAERAKREGDRLVLGDDDELEAGGATPETAELTPEDAGRRPSQQRKVPSKLVLRLYCAAPTPLDPIVPASQHLEPPPLTRNFLISPPGSPPDGWEPIVEDPPNCATLATDLMAALEKLSARAARGEKEVILPEAVAGVGVTVQDMTPDADDADDGGAGGALGAGAFDPSAEIFESEEGRRRGSIGLVRATVDSFGGPGGAGAEDDSLFGGAADAFAPPAGLPSFALGAGVESVPRKAKIAPTPMPPLPLR